MSADLRIFLSSTSRDLSDVRHEVLRFLEVLRSDIVAMETFGSDESAPKDVCLRNVKRSNLFIGIYAERYGAVDAETGLSLTELEYRQAYELLQQGRLRGLLLYCVHPAAEWPIEHIDRDPESISKLQTFKDTIADLHTLTFFRQRSELPFLILRDVIAKIGLGTGDIFRPQAPASPRPARHLTRPVGMEFYDENLAPFFAGRDRATEALMKHVTASRFALLIGSSGVGKTSLVRAGLFTQAKALGWRTAIARPLSDMRSAFWAQLMEGAPPNHFDLVNTIRAICSAYEPSRVLLVIDQFEDVLSPNSNRTVEQIAAELGVLYTALPANLRILVCYRADAEADLGVAWQLISGSPAGLPRYYLDALSTNSTLEALSNNLEALRPNLSHSAGPFIEHLAEDLAYLSHLNGYSGAYPPFLQIAITWTSAADDRDLEDSYRRNGGLQQIVADYLVGQLRFLGRQEHAGRRLVVALASSYGTKAQRAINELAHEAHLDISVVNSTVKQLVDLRLVRQVGEHFELAHDFVAQSVIKQLASSQELEAKMYRELLVSRASAYAQTGSLLTAREHLHIYRHRADILCGETEVELLLRGYLACTGPVFYWASHYGRTRLIAWTRTLINQLDAFGRARAYSLLVRLGDTPSLEELTDAWSEWEYRHELAADLGRVATREDVDRLVRLHRSDTPEVSRAAKEALVRLIAVDDDELLDRLAKSRSPRTELLFWSIATNAVRKRRLDRTQSLRYLRARERWRQLLGINALSEVGTADDVFELQTIALHTKRSGARSTAAARAIGRIAARLYTPEPLVMLRAAVGEDPYSEVMSSALSGLTSPLPGFNVDELMALAERPSASYSFVHAALAMATRKDLPALERAFQAADSPISPYRPPNVTANLVHTYCELAGSKGLSSCLNGY